MTKEVRTALRWLTAGWFVMAGFLAYVMYLVIQVSEINITQNERLQQLERSAERA